MSATTPELERIRSEIVADPENAWAVAANYEPIYVADKAARIVVVGQAPGRKAQESKIPWNDASGARLIDWLVSRRRNVSRPVAVRPPPDGLLLPG